MSKANSNHFTGTIGSKLSRAFTSDGSSNITIPSESDIISSRTRGLDLRDHPLKYKELSPKQRSSLRKKVANRTITKTEYHTYQSNIRLNKRRNSGIDKFWKEEKKRLISKLPTTRQWTPEQANDILHGRRPKHNGRTLHSHHTYSVSHYPHLANQGGVIFPATFREHFYGWHGGNFKNSIPGKPINANLLHKQRKTK
ncbi:MAG: hypothetical protein J6I68_03410 [Butyrivibrio sp.]|uniref:hypothetical protein n=1 Tax=Butyrivibrio sp. TaxID=28121 RepID=UPI001B5EF420|nr:hypothetical protein [Butyrivibrio sp.]MBP3782276.1 hypothetical protein [Butyrivibrio sp.]